MNRKLLWAVALILPLAGFGYTWATTHAAAQLGEEWLIPIKGYDPLDMLRGHFIQYRYDWPVEKVISEPSSESAAPIDEGARAGIEEDARRSLSFASALCLEGQAPNVARVTQVDRPYRSTEEVMSEVRKGPKTGNSDHCAIIARATLGTRREVRGLDTGILYVSEEKARTYQDKLADPKIQGFVRVKIRPDGVMRPIAMEFFPRAR